MLYYYARIMYLLAYTALIPAIASIILGENIYFVISCFMASGMLYFFAYLIDRNSTPGELSILDAYTLTALSFLTAGLVAAIPLMVYDDPLNALFEGVSAITTTGLSSLKVSSLTPGVHFLRAFYQWIGGLSIALLTITILIQPGSTAYNIYIVRMGRFKPKPLSSSAIKLILKIYVALTIFFIIVYVLSGQEVFTALINSLTTVSTGGFSTINYLNGIIMYPVMIFMFMSAQPILIYYFLFRERRFLRRLDVQVFSFTIIVLLSGFLFSIISSMPFDKSFFQVISALSTTDYTSINNNLISDSGKLLLSILMIIGAGMGSTGGGFKQLRLVILIKSIINTLKKPLLPKKSISIVKIRSINVEFEEVEWTYMLLLVYLIILLISTLIFTIYGYSLVDSLFESSSALATTGLSVGLSGPALENPLKILLIIDMLLGRVEIIPFIYLAVYVWRMSR
jgi:trk system potassium uptake protein TrkH